MSASPKRYECRKRKRMRQPALLWTQPNSRTDNLLVSGNLGAQHIILHVLRRLPLNLDLWAVTTHRGPCRKVSLWHDLFSLYISTMLIDLPQIVGLVICILNKHQQIQYHDRIIVPQSNISLRLWLLTPDP